MTGVVTTELRARRPGRLALFFRTALLAVMFLTLTPPMVSTCHAQTDDTGIMGASNGDAATTHFTTLQSKLKNFAVVILLIMLVVAAIMAAMQKTGMAISVAIAAIILFGGIWILKLLQTGLQGSG